MIRFPSLKLAAVCLGLLFLYDIFWVFFSEYIFSKNVMVEVATKSAANPLQAFGVLLKIPILEASQPKLELPIKLLMSASLLLCCGCRLKVEGYKLLRLERHKTCNLQPVTCNLHFAAGAPSNLGFLSFNGNQTRNVVPRPT